MRAKRVLAMGIGLGAFTGMAAVSGAAFECFQSSASVCGGRTTFAMNGEVRPKALPARAKVPVTMGFQGAIGTEGDTHPPSLREAVFDFDRHGSIDATGLPACMRRRIEGRAYDAARNACRDAIVGHGTARIQVARDNSEPLSASARLTVFNGGASKGVTKLLVHATIGLSQSVPVIATVAIKKAQRGHYGWTSIVKIPRLFDGAGSLISFELTIGRRFRLENERRSLLTARCFDGKLVASMTKAVLRAEAGDHSTTTLSGFLAKPCVASAGVRSGNPD